MSIPVSVSAGSRRFWVAVLCFAVANAAVWVGYDRWQKAHRHSLLEVTQFTPGESAIVEGRPILAWSFNLDVAPPAPDAPPLGKLSPRVEGKWRWRDARTLTFQPDSPLKKATPYIVTLASDALHTPDGFRLSKPFVASMKTPALQVFGVRQAAFDDADRIVIEIAFNDSVVPADVCKHLRLIGSDGHDIAFHPHGDAVGTKVRVITDPVSSLFASRATPRIDVKIAHGLAGKAGPLGLTDDVAEPLSIAADLLATDASASYPAQDKPSINIRFNNEIDAQAIRQVISIQPPVPFTVTAIYSGVYLSGAFAPGTRYAVTLSKPPAGMAAKRLPRPTVLSVLIPDRQPGLWFEHEFGYLGAAGNRTVMVHAVNTADVLVAITRVYDNNLVAWRNGLGSQGYYRDAAEILGRPLATRTFHLPTKKNQQQDLPISIDDLLPAGAAGDGVYQITVAHAPQDTPAVHPLHGNDDEDDDSAYTYRYGRESTMVTLSDIGLSAKQGRDGVTVWATSLQTAKPLAGINVRVYSNKNQLLGEGTTGADGLVNIPMLAAGLGEKPAVVIAQRPAVSNVRDEHDPADGADAAAIKASAHVAGARLSGRGLTWLDLHAGQIAFGEADIAGRRYLRTGYEAFVYSDRGVYRPGEIVHLRAILRGPDNSMPEQFPVVWQIRRPDLRDWKSQGAQVDGDGATIFDLALPSDLPSGRWTAHVGLPGSGKSNSRFFGSVAFDVEDFMPQRMKVSVAIDGATLKHGPQADRMMLGEKLLTARVQADYLFGRPVAERPASLVVRVDPVAFAPAAYHGWTFGDSCNAAQALGSEKVLGRRAELSAASTDVNGRAKWEVDVAQLIDKGAIDAPPSAGVRRRPSRARAPDMGVAGATPGAAQVAALVYAGPWRLSVTGSVTETGGRAVTAARVVDVDRIAHYVGLRPRDTAPRPGVAATFDVSLVTPAGALDKAHAKLQVSFYRESWNSSYIYKDGRYEYQSTLVLEPLTKAARTVEIADGKGEITVTPPAGGSYVLLACDSQTHAATSLRFYAGLGMWDDNISRQNPERLDLVVQPLADPALAHDALAALKNRDWRALLELAGRNPAARPGPPSLLIGQRAQVIVRSPFPGKLLLSIETDGVLTAKVLDMPTTSIAVPIDITESMRPNAYVTATVIRPIDPNAKWVIHRAVGVLRLVLDNTDRKLTVQLAAPKEVRPSASLGVQLRVIDSSGNAVANAAITVAAVDEGICQFTNFVTPDPFAYFTGHRALGIKSSDLYSQLMPEVPRPGKQSTVGGDEGSAFGLRRGSPVGARRVKPVALICGLLHTDSQGLAHADFSLPQFTGQLRIMAVASEEKRFGSADVPVLVRSPLLVQSSWPRFATPGDTFSVPLTVFNNSPVAGQVAISVELGDSEPLRFAANKGTKLTLPAIALKAGGQGVVAFDVVARDQIGVAHATLRARMNDEMFGEDVELPIRPASPSISVGGYALAKPSAPATVAIPAGFLDGTIKYELRVSSIPELQLPEGLDYLDRYPYGCLEQTTSTLFPLVYLNDIGAKIAPGVFDKARIEDKVQVGFVRLMSMQTADGGLAMWPGGYESWPWGTVYATHFVVEAQAAGFETPEEFRGQLLSYLHDLLAQPEGDAQTVELQSYAAYVLALAGKPDRAVMSRLSELVKDDASDSARFHLAAAWLAAGRRDLAQNLLPQSIPAPRADRQLSGNLGSPIRDRAILVSTLLAVDPDDGRIPDLVQKLADAGRAHQWRSTQDVAFSVMAIGRYLRQVKSQVPYDGVEFLLDGNVIASATEGKPLVWTAAALDPKMSSQRAAGAAKLPPEGAKIEVRVTGPSDARAHVAWLQTGVALKPTAGADNGLQVRRRYLDEHGKPLEALRVHSGDLVQVELTLKSDSPLENLVIEDLLPAGLEIENPRLQGNADALAVRPHRSKGIRNQGNAGLPGFNAARADRRDDRLILVGNLGRGGSSTYLYTARAVAPGTFVLGPVKAECMYDSGVNSLSGATKFVVLPASEREIANANE
ncbi:MAG TPA: MG2 domain-containing protein [Tepidisphaeraceae bacterium]|nr:MG2 domain-containing protein [Tepidisphaeraceae bacterium]